MTTNSRSRMELIVSMMIFGSIGAIRRFSDLPSSVMLWMRAAISIVVILLILRIAHKKLDLKAIQRNWKILVCSGLLLCINWVFIFEAYKNTAVSVASLCYYTQPAFVILITAIFYKEKHSSRSIVCVVIALLGMIPVSGIFQSSSTTIGFLGVVEALIAAILYAMDIIVSRDIKDVSPYDATLVRMAVSCVVLFVYSLFTEDYRALTFNTRSILVTIILGVVYSGLVYVLYYSAIRYVKSAEIAAISYIDPLESVLLSVFLLHEPISVFTVVGAIMILGSTLFNELAEIKS